MQQTKIKGLNIFLDFDIIKIIDSYKIKNIEKIDYIINEALKKGADKNLYYNIKVGPLIKQWQRQNLLYKLHIFRSKTKDCTIKIERNRNEI